jgi:hypothetical protein
VECAAGGAIAALAQRSYRLFELLTASLVFFTDHVCHGNGAVHTRVPFSNSTKSTVQGWVLILCQRNYRTRNKRKSAQAADLGAASNAIDLVPIDLAKRAAGRRRIFWPLHPPPRE